MSESGNSAGSTRAMVPFTNDPSSTHNTTRANFKCPVPRCGRTFVHHYDLRSHIRTHSQGNSPQPSSSLLSIRSTPESSGYQSDTGSQEGAHRRGQRRAIEGPRLSSLSQSGDIQFESQSSISDVWPQQTTHPAPYMAALSLSEPGTANPTPLRNTSPASQHDTEGESGEAFGAASLPLEISSSSDRGLGHGNTEPESEARHISQGTKRRLEDDHEPNNEEEGGKPKRGKVIHRDYADVLSDQVESFSPKEYSIEDATQSVEADDPTSDARLTVKIQTGQLSCEEMFRCLVAHGCADLSSEMDPKQYSAGLIQGGAFGDIWKGKLHDGTEVAIKVWRFSSLIANNSKSLKRAMREIYHWSKVKHEYVQELMGVIMFQGRLGMVSRWMNNGNLREHIHKSPGADRYALVATGIAHLHNRELEMVHGDLKGTNILVSSEGVAKLSDFDHSIMSECSLAFSDTSKPGGGTTRWMAPELVLDENCCRSTFTDVYALGMTMLEIITGTSPYYPQCKDDVGVIKAIMTKTLPVRPMDHLGDNSRDNQMWELLLRCWKYDPLARPKAAEVVKSLNAIIALPATGNPV